MSHSTDISLSLEVLSEPAIADNINVIPNPPRKKINNIRIILLKRTKMQELRTFD